MAEHQLPKLTVRVRFPSSAPIPALSTATSGAQLLVSATACSSLRDTEPALRATWALANVDLATGFRVLGLSEPLAQPKETRTNEAIEGRK